MTVQDNEANVATAQREPACGLCGKADPNIKPPDDQTPGIGSVSSWKVVRVLRSSGNARPHSFMVRLGAITCRIHHTQLAVDSQSIRQHDLLDLMTVDIDTFDPCKPLPVLSQKGAVFAAQKGRTIKGVVTSVTKYGVFVSSTDLPVCIKGLIHKSKLAGFNKVEALKNISVGAPILFWIDDFKQHPDSARRVAGDWQVDCSEERAAYVEAFQLLESAGADANVACAMATVAGRSHRHESFLVEITLPSGLPFVARLKAPPTDVLHKGDRLQVRIDAVDWAGEQPSAEATRII
ncbi:MAG TPA: S1 RNA-binding domain-containing protein [Drouetiella sp.]|jgi:S1 RNA binding domain